MPDDDTKIDDGDDDIWMPDDDTKIDDGGISLPDSDAGMKQVSGKKYVYVNVSAGSTLTLRAAPDAASAAKRSLPRGTKLQLLAYDDEWTRVRMQSGHRGLCGAALPFHRCACGSGDPAPGGRFGLLVGRRWRGGGAAAPSIAISGEG